MDDKEVKPSVSEHEMSFEAERFRDDLQIYYNNQYIYDDDKRNLISHGAILSNVEFNEFYLSCDSPRMRTSYGRWVFSTLKSKYINLVKTNEKIGDYILMPKYDTHNIVSSFNISTKVNHLHNGWSCQGFTCSYKFIYSYRYTNINTKHFYVLEVCKAEYEPISVRFNNWLEKIKDILTFGKHGIETKIRYVNFGYVVQFPDGHDSAFGATRLLNVYVPGDVVNKAIGKSFSARSYDVAEQRIRTWMSNVMLHMDYCDDATTLGYAYFIVACKVWNLTMDEGLPKVAKYVCPDYKQITDVIYAYPGVKRDLGQLATKNFPHDLYDSLDDDLERLSIGGLVYSPCRYKNVCIPARTTLNTLNALAERQFKEYNNQFSDYDMFASFMRKILPVIYPVNTVDVPKAKIWYDNRTDVQKARYIYSSFEECHANVAHTRKDAQRDLFLKTNEKLYTKDISMIDGWGEDYSLYPISRIIIQNRPEQNAMLGPYIYTAGKMMAEMHGGDGDCDWLSYTPNGVISNILYAGGKNAIDIGKFVHQRIKSWDKVKAYSTDFSKYDAHQMREHKKIEIMLFSHLLPGVKDLVELLSTQCKIEAHARDCRKSEAKYTCGIDYRRASGEQNTSSGNSGLNLLMQLFTLNKQFNVLKALQNGKLLILYFGDDCLLLSNFDIDDQVYIKDMESLGMKVELEVSGLYGANFLSRWFCPCTYVLGDKTYDTLVLTPNIGRNLCGAYVSVHKYSLESHAKAWVKSNAIAYKHMFGHIEFMHNWHTNVERGIDKSYSKYFKNIITHPRFFWLDEGRVGPRMKVDIKNNKSINKITCASNETVTALKMRYNLSEANLKSLNKLFQNDVSVKDFDEPIIDQILMVDLCGIIHDRCDNLSKCEYKSFDYYIENDNIYIDDGEGVNITINDNLVNHVVDYQPNIDRTIPVDSNTDMHINNHTDKMINASDLSDKEETLLMRIFKYHPYISHTRQDIINAYNSMIRNRNCGISNCKCVDYFKRDDPIAASTYHAEVSKLRNLVNKWDFDNHL